MDAWFEQQHWEWTLGLLNTLILQHAAVILFSYIDIFSGFCIMSLWIEARDSGHNGGVGVENQSIQLKLFQYPQRLTVNFFSTNNGKMQTKAQKHTKNTLKTLVLYRNAL